MKTKYSIFITAVLFSGIVFSSCSKESPGPAEQSAGFYKGIYKTPDSTQTMLAQGIVSINVLADDKVGINFYVLGQSCILSGVTVGFHEISTDYVYFHHYQDSIRVMGYVQPYVDPVNRKMLTMQVNFDDPQLQDLSFSGW